MMNTGEGEGTAPPLPERTRWDYLERYVGPNWDGFRPVAERLRKGGIGFGWSWSALLFQGLWLVYRRRVAWGVIILLLPGALDYLMPDANDYLSLPGVIAIGVFGKGVYLRHALWRIDQIVAATSDERERLRQIDRAGGVDGNAVLVVVLLSVGLSVALLFYIQQLLRP